MWFGGLGFGAPVFFLLALLKMFFWLVEGGELSRSKWQDVLVGF